MRKRTGRRRQGGSWWQRIPPHFKVLIEVLAVALVLHYVKIPVNEVLPLLKLYM